MTLKRTITFLLISLIYGWQLFFLKFYNPTNLTEKTIKSILLVNFGIYWTSLFSLAALTIAFAINLRKFYLNKNQKINLLSHKTYVKFAFSFVKDNLFLISSIITSLLIWFC